MAAPSIQERIYKGSGGRFRLFAPTTPGFTAWGLGKDQMRGRLIGEADDRPMLVCFYSGNFQTAFESIPALQQ